MIEDEQRILREIQRQRAAAFAAEVPTPSSGRRTAVFKVFNAGKMPTTVPNQFAAHEITLSGPELEGAVPTVGGSKSLSIVTVLGPEVPKVGDLILARQESGKWVGRRGTPPKKDGAGSPCGVAGLPSAYHATLTMPVASDPPQVDDCRAGWHTGLGTFPFSLTYGTHTWNGVTGQWWQSGCVDITNAFSAFCFFQQHFWPGPFDIIANFGSAQSLQFRMTCPGGGNAPGGVEIGFFTTTTCINLAALGPAIFGGLAFETGNLLNGGTVTATLINTSLDFPFQMEHFLGENINRNSILVVGP